MKRILTLACIFYAFSVHAQRWQVELLAGESGYSGDLTKNAMDFYSVRPGLNLNVKYKINNWLTIRSGIAYGRVAGHDRTNKDSLLMVRNLSFETKVIEGNVCVELALLNPELFGNYPYLFVGAGLFHFNPYAYDKTGHKVYLKPLGTEGQGLSEYPDRKEYSLTQFCIPMGGGIRIKLNNQISLGAEVGFRKLFTDYFDDVSKGYVDPEVLESQKGAKALEMAYRGKNGGYPHINSIRGNPNKKDWYYFGGIKFTWTFGTINNSSKSSSTINKEEKEKTKSKTPLKVFPQRQ